MATTQTPPLLGALAHFAAKLDLARVPEAVRRQAGLCILDTIGCMLAGAETPEAAMVLAAERDASGDGAARILGSPIALRPEAAARVHGYWGDIFELNDLIGGHASIGNVTAALALVEPCGSSGADLLRALIAGIEITTRIYAAVYPQLKPYTEVGMVTPGLVSAFGAAAVAGSLQGFSEPRLQEALAIAGTLATWCPAEVIFGDGGTVKPMLFGAWPAAIGIRAAGYAGHGMTGPARLLESPMGFCETLSRGYDPAVFTDDARWYLAEPRRKLHACCGYTHSAIDAVAALRREVGTAAMQRGRLRIGMPAYVLPAVSKTRLPQTPNEARFHAEYCIALAACGLDVILPEHSLGFREEISRPELRQILGAIEIVAAPELTHYHQCILDFDSPGLAPRHIRADAPKGSPQNPMADAEVIQKFQRLSASRLSAAAAATYAEKFLALEVVADCGWIFDDLQGG
ncbi:2-methylcitrate dehydratase PrpD [Humitalea rosea]|uniref:2-methylcitrate dehydratase PrpD n=1 Tax=Humitalea rosea TaxID=990373 RepID=A0A2W7IDJ8_9PROT|nr:MmgE/PrpD family protein [Humitalea rosea]PZW44814.1 2-methylcitrate dehydratase PrpD [Humitalea rosea]